MGKRNRERRIELPTNVIEMRPSVPVELHRSFDAADINPILNHPSVFPSIVIPGIEKFDVSDVVDDPKNVLLMTEGGGILFYQIEPGIYDIHTNFLPEYRGRHAIRASLEAYRWMFTRTDCMVLTTRVPENNKAAHKFCSIVGATLEFVREKVWPTNESMIDLSFYSLRYDDWVRKTPNLMKSGQAFHDRLEAERVRLNHPVPIHPDEECHNLHVGACAEMIYGGQPEKGVVLYNRWCAFVGFNVYKPVSLISKSPMVIDIAQALLLIGDNDFKVLKWR